MPKNCDHKSVGMLVWKNGELLLIERKKPPFGFAPPAGHLDEDGDDFGSAAKRELMEEVGLDAGNMELVAEGKKENHCRREGGTWHYWKIYKIAAEGEIKRSEDETKQAEFYSKEKINLLISKTKEYIQGKLTEEDWEKSPGIEPVWYEWLKELKIVE
jgi:ADP-ribose pyrophosphatase YjhB (NUDIX family)